MIPLEFKEFITAGKDDKHLGIVTVLWNGITLRLKIQKTKEGNNMFAAASSFKVTNPITLEDGYILSFEIDSRSEDDRVKKFALSHAKVKLGMTSMQNTNAGSGHAQWTTQAPPMQYPESQTNLPYPKEQQVNLPF